VVRFSTLCIKSSKKAFLYGATHVGLSNSARMSSIVSRS
jgi:hypothetical protein